MVASGLSASRIQQAYHVLGSVFKSAVRNQMISNNPAEGVKLPEKPQREMLFLSGDEVDRLASAVPVHYGALVYTLAYEGYSGRRSHRVAQEQDQPSPRGVSDHWGSD